MVRLHSYGVRRLVLHLWPPWFHLRAHFCGAFSCFSEGHEQPRTDTIARSPTSQDKSLIGKSRVCGEVRSWHWSMALPPLSFCHSSSLCPLSALSLLCLPKIESQSNNLWRVEVTRYQTKFVFYECIFHFKLFYVFAHAATHAIRVLLYEDNPSQYHFHVWYTRYATLWTTGIKEEIQLSRQSVLCFHCIEADNVYWYCLYR